MARENHGRVVIVGCGRLGAYLASRLSLRGVEVVVLDLDDASFENLSPQFGGFRFEGDATQLAVLRKARVDEADAVVVTTRDDNTNMMVAQVAKRVLGVPCAIARVFEPSREAIYHGLEIATVCPTTLAADAAIELVCGLVPSLTEARP